MLCWQFTGGDVGPQSRIIVLQWSTSRPPNHARCANAVKYEAKEQREQSCRVSWIDDGIRSSDEEEW
jgi:hypothetical protein